MEPDHYRILQVDSHAETEVIDAAYRRLAAKYHPDRDTSPGATDRMRLINAAYEVLSDSEKRQLYDRRRGPLSGLGVPSGQTDVRRGRSWSSLVVALGLILLMSLTVLVRFNPRFLLVVGVVLLVAWTVHVLRTPERS